MAKKKRKMTAPERRLMEQIMTPPRRKPSERGNCFRAAYAALRAECDLDEAAFRPEEDHKPLVKSAAAYGRALASVSTGKLKRDALAFAKKAVQVSGKKRHQTTLYSLSNEAQRLKLAAAKACDATPIW